MGLRISTNVQSLVAQRNLGTSVDKHTASMEKVSSGSRINKAADDAAGLAVSEKLKADIRGLNMAKRNASDGISLIQTAEGGLNEIGNILSRLRELSVQSASDTIGNNERGFLNKEFSALKEEITRISKSTEFNGTTLIAGDPAQLDPNLSKLSNGYPLEIQVGKNFYNSADAVGTTETPVNTIRIDLGSINATATGLELGENANEGANVADKAAAQTSIETLDKAINSVSGFRAELGATQSRLSSTINNLSIQAESANAANSRVRDTDFAEETAKLTQANIQKQASTSVLASANQNPQIALRLLG